MLRRCAHCNRNLGPRDLARDQSKEMEAERKAIGLEGLLFRYYTCPSCGYADIFVDVLRLDGETAGELRQRKEELEVTARQLQAEQVEVVVATR